MNTAKAVAAAAAGGPSSREDHDPRLPRDERERRAHRGVFTQRRRARTQSIRKQKKNQYVAHRRGLLILPAEIPSANNFFTNHPDLKFFLVANSSPQQNQSQTLSLPPVTKQLVLFVEQCITNAQQQQQSRGPSFSSINCTNSNNTFSSNDTNGPLLLLGTDEEQLALQFLDQLRQQAYRASTVRMAAMAAVVTNDNVSALPYILQVLVQLTSLSTTTTSAAATQMYTTATATTNDTAHYYGRSPSTWSRLLVQSSSSPPLQLPSWVELLLQILTRMLIVRSNNSTSQSDTGPHSIPGMVELTCLVLGNILGDETVTEALLFPPSLSFHNNTYTDAGRNLVKATLITRLIRTVSLFATTATAAATAALWTLTTLIRKDTISPAAIYCALEEKNTITAE